jgi:hypothetical protein
MNNSVPKASLREKAKRYAEGIPSGKVKNAGKSLTGFLGDEPVVFLQ